MIKADEAHRLGLVNHVVEPGEEVNKAREILTKIATKAPLAIAKTISNAKRPVQQLRLGF